MVFDPWIGDIVSIPCLHGRCKRDPGVPGVWRHKTPNPGVEKRDPGVESLHNSDAATVEWLESLLNENDLYVSLHAEQVGLLWYVL